MITRIESPVGTLLAALDGRGALGYLGFHGHEPRPERLARLEAFEGAGGEGGAAALREQLAAYFEGRLRRFDLPLAPQGTPFQLRVWAALGDIPYGATLSYGELARRLGDPGLSRAVGAANGANPISIVIPCHRVIGKDGRLTGYAGGLDIKARLLDLERGPGPFGWL